VPAATPLSPTLSGRRTAAPAPAAVATAPGTPGASVSPASSPPVLRRLVGVPVINTGVEPMSASREGAAAASSSNSGGDVDSIYRLRSGAIPSEAPAPPPPPAHLNPYNTMRGPLIVDPTLAAQIAADALLLSASEHAEPASVRADASNMASPPVSPRSQRVTSGGMCSVCNVVAAVARVSFAATGAETCSPCGMKLKQAEMSNGQRPPCERVRLSQCNLSF
jgi:hypothetical protein